MTPIRYNDETIVPGKIICIGRNYVEHIKELGNDIPNEMVVFNKPASAISEQLVAVHQEPLHYETELCLLLRNQQIVGVGVGMDLTKRHLQSQLKAKGLPWERAKAFDGAATFSQFVSLPGQIKTLSFSLHIDGKLQQQGDPSLMIYPPATILRELGKFSRLEDNDVIMTGTPKGVGPVIAGAEYVVRLYHDHQVLIEHTWKGQEG